MLWEPVQDVLDGFGGEGCERGFCVALSGSEDDCIGLRACFRTS